MEKEVAPITVFLPRNDKTFNVLINVTLTCIHETIVAVECSKYYVLWLCVCILALVIQCAMCTHIICGLSGYAVFFHIFS